MPIYLDNNATTAMDERVVEAMMPYLSGPFGNPSSTHRYGRAAREAIDVARAQVASLVGAQANQLVFTGGGSEANNLAIKGVALAQQRDRSAPFGRLLISGIEHDCVLEPAEALASQGWALDVIPAQRDGTIAPSTVQQMLADQTKGQAALVSVMMANNETGVLQDVAAIAKLARDAGAVMHTDAVQAAGKIPVDFRDSGAHLMTLSAHKLYGPKGVGALIADRSVDLEPLIHGGGHERGLRAGTENLASIVGFGMAAQLAREELEQRQEYLLELRQMLEQQLSFIPELTLFGEHAARTPNTVQLSVPGFDGEALLMELDRMGIAVSSGSACSSGTTEPSHVLMAMGIERDVAVGAIRVSLGMQNTAQHVQKFVMALQACIAKRQNMAGVVGK